jgi:hypothetical protein
MQFENINRKFLFKQEVNNTRPCVQLEELGSRVFIPEILICIFGFLDDARDYSNSSKVNRVWRSVVWSAVHRLDLDKYTIPIYLTNSSLQWLTLECRRIRVLNLRYCRGISDVGKENGYCNC